MDTLLHTLESSTKQILRRLHEVAGIHKSYDDPFCTTVDTVLRRVDQQLNKLSRVFQRKTLQLQNREWDGTLLFGELRFVPDFRDTVRKVIVRERVINHWKGKEHSFSPPSPTYPMRSVMDLLEPVLDVNSWEGVDVFKLEETTGSPLANVFHTIWNEQSFSNICKTSEQDALKYIDALSNAYGDLPYHNCAHAAASAIMYFWWKSLAICMPDYITGVDMLIAVLAAAMHDVGHPGLTNDFLVKTENVLGLRYNDQCIMENFHAATGFELMHSMNINLLSMHPRCAYINPVPQSAALRKRVIDMVLATDMARHKESLA